MWLMIVREPGIGEPVVQVILRDCRWTEYLLAKVPKPFGGPLVGEDICIGGSLY